MPIRAAKVRKIPQIAMPLEGQKLPQGIKKAQKGRYLRKFNYSKPSK